MSGKSISLLQVLTHPDGHISIMANLEGRLFMEDGKWISYCSSLELATCGDTKEEAIKNTEEAIRLFFDACVKKGTLEKALKELGWKVEDKIVLKAINQPEKITPPPAFMIDSIKNDNWFGHVEL